MAIVYRFKGNGSEFYSGIPARNLTEEDWNNLDSDQKKIVTDSALYDKVSKSNKDGE